MSDSKPNSKLMQYAALQSFVSPTFWHKLAENKLNLDRLSDAPKPVYGYYTNRSATDCFLEVDYTAFSSTFKAPKFNHAAHGTIYNKNTIEEFKDCDKKALIKQEAEKLLEDFKSDAILKQPSLLARFFVLSFADLKCHSYYYWFCFPCPLTATNLSAAGSQKITEVPVLQDLATTLENLEDDEKQFFAIKTSHESPLEYLTLAQCIEGLQASTLSLEELYFCFADPSKYEYPAWLMRTYVAFVISKCPKLLGKSLKFLGLRYDQKMCLDNSMIWNVEQHEDCDLIADKFVGWEPNANKRLGPRMVSMQDSMDPKKLAENSVNLNLKLMKWRLVPDLDLDIVAQTKCLLFGAGTLGCAVARNLLSWGFRHVSLIDNGKVGYSNPIRQNLYLHADAVAGNVKKATIAAERLKDINPNTTTAGYVMQIPMPGHTIGASMVEQTTDDLNKITNLVEQHDVIFLLTDSRESRWLPTMLGAAFNKVVINAALGFDSYLVMRHGAHSKTTATDVEESTLDIGDLKCIKGEELGCYFCNDVTAPGNSLKDRTLDQQCTVTRPGVSNIAASYAVELLVSLLQHPQRHAAPAYYSSMGTSNAKVPEGLLGIIPHSIRGMLCNFENILPATQKFTQCIACSERVLAEYRSAGNDFLFKAFETAKYLEDLTGISDFKELSNEIIDFDDSDLEMSDG